jgi:hypothetical protein
MIDLDAIQAQRVNKQMDMFSALPPGFRRDYYDPRDWRTWRRVLGAYYGGINRNPWLYRQYAVFFCNESILWDGSPQDWWETTQDPTLLVEIAIDVGVDLARVVPPVLICAQKVLQAAPRIAQWPCLGRDAWCGRDERLWHIALRAAWRDNRTVIKAADFALVEWGNAAGKSDAPGARKISAAISAVHGALSFWRNYPWYASGIRYVMEAMEKREALGVIRQWIPFQEVHLKVCEILLAQQWWAHHMLPAPRRDHV